MFERIVKSTHDVAQPEVAAEALGLAAIVVQDLKAKRIKVP